MVPFWIAMYGPQGQNQALTFTYRNYPVYQFPWFNHQLQQLDPLRSPLIENQSFQYTPFWIAKNGPDGHCRELVLIAGIKITIST